MKTSLVKAFRYCLVPSLRLGMLIIEAPPRLLAADPPGVWLARNEVLKEFQLKLTPMAIAKCLRYYRNPI
ncbi:MAG: hypothetical protein V7L22_17420 [Nostoc sp.]|uniref:hypothetical protein n=1 Tax=Nostoc sp. TaxID=1180 RepID=UPI002FFCD174